MPRPAHKKSRPTTLRVIAGDLRGRKILYQGNPSTRPMRDSVREALFNILSTTVRDAIAWDLFAGTGALSVESISRGAYRAVAMEFDREAVEAIRKTLTELRLTDRIEVITGDTFRLAARMMTASDTTRPWIVFVCPPYELMERRPEAIVELVRHALERAPAGSQLVVEMDDHWDVEQLPTANWDIRKYGSTRLAFAEVVAVSPDLAPPE